MCTVQTLYEQKSANEMAEILYQETFLYAIVEVEVGNKIKRRLPFSTVLLLLTDGSIRWHHYSEHNGPLILDLPYGLSAHFFIAKH